MMLIGLVTKLCLTLATPWTVACQAPLSLGFLRQEYWSRLPFLSPGDLPDPGIEPVSPALQEDCLLMSHQGSPIPILGIMTLRHRLSNLSKMTQSFMRGPEPRSLDPDIVVLTSHFCASFWLQISFPPIFHFLLAH